MYPYAYVIQGSANAEFGAPPLQLTPFQDFWLRCTEQDFVLNQEPQSSFEECGCVKQPSPSPLQYIV